MEQRVFPTQKLGKQSSCATGHACGSQFPTLESLHLFGNLLSPAGGHLQVGEIRRPRSGWPCRREIHAGFNLDVKGSKSRPEDPVLD
jgi:hypothetical protein